MCEDFLFLVFVLDDFVWFTEFIAIEYLKLVNIKTVNGLDIEKFRQLDRKYAYSYLYYYLLSLTCMSFCVVAVKKNK